MRHPLLAFGLLACLLSGCPKEPPANDPTPAATDPTPDEAEETPDEPLTPTDGVAPAQGEPCPDDRCTTGLTCVGYYGIAGMNGPRFTSCEIPCPADTTCPDGQACVTIADGPGAVCRPASSEPAAGLQMGEACPDGGCADGLSCVGYYGIAGMNGPRFTSCEIPCPSGERLPVGQELRDDRRRPGAGLPLISRRAASYLVERLPSEKLRSRPRRPSSSRRWPASRRGRRASGRRRRGC